MKLFKAALCLIFIMPCYACFAQEEVNWWLTSSDKSALLDSFFNK